MRTPQSYAPASFQGNLIDAWDSAAEAIDHDPMRPVRYGKCLRYFHSLNRGSHLLEVGCGEGTGLLFARHLGFCRLTGCDISPERLRRAGEKLKDEAALVLVSDDGRLPFEDGTFDAVFSAAVIEHALDPALFVAEIARVVRPGGCVVISSDCWQWRLLQVVGAYRSVQPIDKAMFPTRLLALFRGTGLRVVHYEGFSLSGEEWRFLRLLAGSILRNRLTERIISRIRRVRTQACPGKTESATEPKQVESEQDVLSRHATSPVPSRNRVLAFLRLVFSDENVFHLVKPGIQVNRG